MSREGRGWHRRVNGLHVLHLEGSFYEMGRQHGVLLRDAIRRGPLHYYACYLERLLASQGAARLAPALTWILQQSVGRSVRAQLPAFARELIAGLAAGAALPLGDVLDGVTLPDTLVWLVSKALRLGGARPEARHRVALDLACSSAVAWGAATRDGKLLHARNLDYQGGATWTREAAVIFARPDDGQPYVAVAAAGIMLGGVTAMNQAGLTLAIHQHMFCDESALGGTPVGVTGDLIMRHATSLDEAEVLLRAQRPIGCWTYIIADGRRRQVLCHEQTARRAVTFRSGPTERRFHYTNIYLDPALGSRELSRYGSYWRSNLGRYRRLQHRLDAADGQIDRECMASILADVGGDGCRLSAPIAGLTTVTSVVFSPEDGLFWVGTGDPPTSHQRFEPFDLRRGDHAPDQRWLWPGERIAPSARQAFDAYRSAATAWFDDGDRARSRRWLEAACELQPAQPLYHAMAGLAALVGLDARGALAHFDSCLRLGHSHPERVASFRLWRARALDLLGRRAEARDAYRGVLEASHGDPPVVRAARRGIRSPYVPSRARRIALEFVYADAMTA